MRHIKEEVVVTQENNAEQLPRSQQQHPSTGSLAVQRPQYEEVTLNLREGNWKAVVNGDFFQPSFHLFNNEVCCTVKRKLVLLSSVTLTLTLRSNLYPTRLTRVYQQHILFNIIRPRTGLKVFIFSLAFTNLNF